MVKENGIPVAEYWYDGLGNRVRSLENGEEIYYIYNGLNIIQEHNVTANSRTDYIFAGIRRIAEKTGGVVRYYHTDHLGSTRLMTDSQGSIVAEYKYYPYGASFVQNFQDPGFDGAIYRFTGKGDSPSTELYYFGARFYDPEVGRFITLDPARDGLNWYEYCGSNPLGYVDPSGYSKVSAYSTVITVGVTIILLANPVGLTVGGVAIGAHLITAAGIARWIAFVATVADNIYETVSDFSDGGVTLTTSTGLLQLGADTTMTLIKGYEPVGLVMGIGGLLAEAAYEYDLRRGVIDDDGKVLYDTETAVKNVQKSFVQDSPNDSSSNSEAGLFERFVNWFTSSICWWD